jgi:hypothetical protein
MVIQISEDVLHADPAGSSHIIERYPDKFVILTLRPRFDWPATIVWRAKRGIIYIR